jgi:hypothetical protein
MISLLAQTTPPPAQNNFGDTLSDGIAGPMALLIIVVLLIATVLLVRNMNSRLRRLPEEFPIRPRGDGGPATAAAGPVGGAQSGAARPSAGQGAERASGTSPDGLVE